MPSTPPSPSQPSSINTTSHFCSRLLLSRVIMAPLNPASAASKHALTLRPLAMATLANGTAMTWRPRAFRPTNNPNPGASTRNLQTSAGSNETPSTPKPATLSSNPCRSSSPNFVMTNSSSCCQAFRSARRTMRPASERPSAVLWLSTVILRSGKGGLLCHLNSTSRSSFRRGYTGMDPTYSLAAGPTLLDNRNIDYRFVVRVSGLTPGNVYVQRVKITSWEGDSAFTPGKCTITQKPARYIFDYWPTEKVGQDQDIIIPPGFEPSTTLPANSGTEILDNQALIDATTNKCIYVEHRELELYEAYVVKGNPARGGLLGAFWVNNVRNTSEDGNAGNEAAVENSKTKFDFPLINYSFTYWYKRFTPGCCPCNQRYPPGAGILFSAAEYISFSSGIAGKNIDEANSRTIGGLTPL